MQKRFLKICIELIGLFFLFLAIYLVYRQVHALGFSDVLDKVTQLPVWILVLALFFILMDYLALSGYDFLALNYIGEKIKKWLVLKTAFISFSVTNTTGHAYVAGGSVRYFFYSKVGLSEFQILKMIAFESLTFLMGMGIVLDFCLILSHFLHIPRMQGYQNWLDVGAVAVTLALIAYVWFVVKPKRQFKWSNIEISAPSLSLTLKQMFVGGLDIFSASLVFYVLFKAHLDAPYLHVTVIFLISQLIGISTQVPGGLGVFEASFLYLFSPSEVEKIPLLAVLISFRVLYYFLPLAVSILLLTAEWIRTLITKRQRPESE